MTSHAIETKNQYNSAKLWQIGLFTLNNTATNLYMFALTFVSYYATGVAGLSVVVISTILTFMRIFDGITDPIIGFIIDKLESKFGKFRPMMFIGNIIMAASIITMYAVTHQLPQSAQFLFFIIIYAIYIIGYTMQTACTKAGQTVLTNNPKQRPLFSVFDATYNIGVFTGGQIFVASYLISKHGDFNNALFTELNTYAIVLSGIFTVLAIIALWTKDRKEFFGLAEQSVQTKFRDYVPILKGNRPLQMLVIAASSDKLAGMVLRQPAVMIMFFGILLGDYALSGTISGLIIIPSLLLTFIGVGYATRAGLKQSLVKATWGALISFAILIVMFLFIDPTDISLSNIGWATVAFLILYALGSGLSGLANAIVIPMIADVADYETYKSGRYVPGMIGTLFSFVDKMISSLAPALVGFLLLLIGYRDEFPQLGETLTVSLFVMTLILKFGIPIAGWIATLIAMKFYNLDREKMAEIQQTIAEIKSKAENETTPEVSLEQKDNLSKEKVPVLD